MRWEKLTEKSQEAMLRAQELARERHHPQVDTEHLLMALLDQADGVVPQVLQRAGASVPRIRQQTEQA
ncbi:MAG: hypothetical protein K6U07_06105, partial [Firmicutes bacterium]|nr:hypothetical protein [Bacillota bacterium]